MNITYLYNKAHQEAQAVITGDDFKQYIVWAFVCQDGKKARPHYSDEPHTIQINGVHLGVGFADYDGHPESMVAVPNFDEVPSVLVLGIGAAMQKWMGDVSVMAIVEND